MKISMKYAELQNVLQYCNTVLNDKSVEEKLKNFIFMVSGDEVKVVGYSVFTFCRVTVENVEEIEDIPENGWMFQVKAAALNKILQSYSNLSKTKASTVTFTEDGVKIKAIVHEEAVDEKDSVLSRDVNYYLECQPILSNISKDIKMAYPENSEVMVCEDIYLYLDCLFPLITNDAGNSRESKINFAPDYVFVMSSHSSAFMGNKLPEAFKGLTITYSSANFLKKICESFDDMNVAKTDKHICIQSGNTEAFMRYQPVKIKYSNFIERMSKDIGIKIDRLYLRDVLKRMSNMSAEGKMYVTDEGELLVENDSFQQTIPLLLTRLGDEKIEFNISVPLLDKIIVGSDSVFPEELFIYLVPTARGYLVYLADETGAWFSSTQVSRV